jgi:hypothetical protein
MTNPKPDTFPVAERQEYAEPMTKYMSNVQDFMDEIPFSLNFGDANLRCVIADSLQSDIPMLWVHKSSFDNAYPSEASIIAVRTIQSALDVGPLTILAFFCREAYDYNPDDVHDGAQQCFIDLVYNLVLSTYRRFTFPDIHIC